MIFTLFKDIVFDVKYPEALIEAYCFQSDFYAKYDLKRPEGDGSFEFVRFIGTRIEKDTLEKCRTEIDRCRDFGMFKMDLDTFLNQNPQETRDQLISKLAVLAGNLDDIPGVGFSKATKILHTRYPKIIPIIDNPLQKEYKRLAKEQKREWKRDYWYQLLKDYYDNFLEKETFDNLDRLHTSLSFLKLTKVRIFDILWWSFLKSKNQDYKNVKWRTIEQLDYIHNKVENKNLKAL